MMNENELRVLKVYIEECEIAGKLLTINEFSEDIENSIGWDEVRNPDYDDPSDVGHRGYDRFDA